MVWILLAGFNQIYSENQEQKEEPKKMAKACNLFRKVHIELGPRKVCLLKRLQLLKRCYALYQETIGKMT